MIEHINEALFDWSIWRGGTLLDLGLVNRTNVIVGNASVLRKYAVGWGYGDRLICRPKPRTIAVMFMKGETLFWTHLREHEFNAVFGGAMLTPVDETAAFVDP